MRLGRGTRRLLSLALAAVFAATLVLPTVAVAATPTPTIKLSTTYQKVAAPLKISGSMGIGKTYAGKKITVQIKKPGRSYWMSMSDRTVSSKGGYSYYYTPKLAGKFFVRSRYGKSGSYKYSRTVSYTVAKGPGVKYQILLASTTSTYDSGIYTGMLEREFLKACPEYTIKAKFGGTGDALMLGGQGDADVLLTHAPSQEASYMAGSVNGTSVPHPGLSRYKVMYNDFVLVGPKSNPAAIDASDSAAAAFGKIAASGSTFWSRNDNSGTNSKEKSLWASIGNPQKGAAWYMASGTMGMAQALSAANEGAGGYTLSDRATWLNQGKLGTVGNLQIVSQHDVQYFNQYSVIEVKGARNWEGARDFSLWIRSAAVQEKIRTWGITDYGQALFVPNQGSW